MLLKQSINYRSLFLIFILAILSVYINGYQFGATDLSLYLSYLPIYQGEPEHYHPDDLIILAKNTGGHFYTFIWYLLIPFIQIIGLEWTVFFIHLISIFFVYLSIYYVCSRIWDAKTAFIIILLFLVKKHIAGTPVATIENTFSIRNIVFPIQILAIWFWLKNRNYLAGLLIGLSGNIHLLSAIILSGLLFITSFIANKFKKLELNLYLFTGVLTGIIPVMFWIFSSTKEIDFGQWLIPQSDWLDILYIRTSFLFISQWNLMGILHLIVLLLFWLILARYPFKSNAEKRIILLIHSGIGIYIFSVIFTDIYPLAFALKFQSNRILQFIFILMVFCIGKILSEYWEKQNKFSAILVWLTILCFLFPAARLGFIFSIIPFTILLLYNNPLSDIISVKLKYILYSIIFLAIILNPLPRWIIKNESPQYWFDLSGYIVGQDWIDMQYWAKNNIAQGSMILSPPDKTGFRVRSNRSVYVEWKDGAMGIYNEFYAREWVNRLAQLGINYKTDSDILSQKYHSLTIEDIHQLSNQKGIQYIIRKKEYPLDLRILYENNQFILYQID